MKRLLDPLYAGVLSEDGFRDFLKIAFKELKVVHVGLTELRGQQPTAVMWEGLGHERQDDYVAHYQFIEPWREPTLRILAPGQADVSLIAVPREVLKKTEFFADFLRPAGGVDGIAAMLSRSGDDFSVLSLVTEELDDAALIEHRALVRALVPHVQRVMAVRRVIAQAGHEANLARFAIDQLTAGVLVLSPDLRVLRANPTAERLLAASDGLVTRDGVLEAVDPDDTTRLQAMLRALAEATQADANPSKGGPPVLRLRRTSGALPLSVAALRAPPPPSGSTVARCDLVLFVTDPEASLDPTEGWFVRLFGFTPAEARLARALCLGSTLDEAAATFGTSANTVRVQLKGLFKKTGTHRQAELLRVLLTSMPPVRLR
jgi:DNA-binding CsgD family transcriptional regulator/PAS domain-containing protein